MKHLTRRAFGILTLLVLATAAVGAQEKKDRPEAFTFLFWTDQEIDQNKNGDYDRCLPTIEAMNTIAGKEYPAALGGTVAPPDFVASGGDSCGWPTRACVESWNKICRELLKHPTRPVAGNHDSGGKVPSDAFYRWMRTDPFIKAHASDNGIGAWTPPEAESGIIPGIQYSFRHKGVVFIMASPTYDNSGKSPPGSSPIHEPDIRWLKKELAKYDVKTPKIVVNHFNAGSITNRERIDEVYEENNVVLHLCGHWEKVQHWRQGSTDWAMDAGHRGDDGTFSVIHVACDRITIAHWSSKVGGWHEKTIDRELPARW